MDSSFLPVNHESLAVVSVPLVWKEKPRRIASVALGTDEISWHGTHQWEDILAFITGMDGTNDKCANISER
ncbi:hypothetical protein NEF87_004491 [Candidatus Lokiarchaeum ossiferum]|uniref:Uncharacterized protein n=1 Tax=Candidatus Lokiarchaeum ossiferum TaxID=2951803 RepID=A0ABY6HXF3_9ARCH|nr:hypothetical protein NEF87_004491 [Candidatus Lokiarchaeum sp. B-35]